ncbi:MAG TPA: hypothetical protein VD837_13270 [Terriglobales bacterium]|nr:hypothetical protein [Terriglobales bacterium]
MNYLSSSEYEMFGLEATVAEAWVTVASALIDSHCRRPTLAVTNYSERLQVVRGRNSVRLTYLPLTIVAPAQSAIVSARARFAVPRRGESVPALGITNMAWVDPEFTEEVALAFGLPGQWTSLNPATLDFCVATGEVTLPTSALGLGFNEVEITYTAGLDPIPNAVKSACAQIVRNALATPALNVRAGIVDRMHLEYFSDTLVDSDVRTLLAPYVAQKVG